MRTHVLVCLGACIIALIEVSFLADLANIADERVTFNFGRMTAQVICGVGFLGAGTIFTSRKKIAGLTTAASLWNTACLGLAVGYGYYRIVLVGCAFVVLILMVIKRLVHVNAMKRLEIKFIQRVETLTFINSYFESRGVQIVDIDFHVENQAEQNLYTNIYTLKLPVKTNYTDIVNDLSENANVQSIRTTNT